VAVAVGLADRAGGVLVLAIPGEWTSLRAEIPGARSVIGVCAAELADAWAVRVALLLLLMLLLLLLSLASSGAGPRFVLVAPAVWAAFRLLPVSAGCRWSAGDSLA
jgi:hypothetical protein